MAMRSQTVQGASFARSASSEAPELATTQGKGRWTALVIAAAVVAGVLGFLFLRPDISTPAPPPTSEELAQQRWVSSLEASRTRAWSAQEQSVIAAIYAFDETLTRLMVAPDLPLSQLEATAAGESLEYTKTSLEEQRAKQQVSTYPQDSVSGERIDNVVFDSPTSAGVTSCSVDDSWVTETTTGRVVDSGVSTTVTRTDVQLIDGTWKVTYANIDPPAEGFVGCAVS